MVMIIFLYLEKIDYVIIFLDTLMTFLERNNLTWVIFISWF